MDLIQWNTSMVTAAGQWPDDPSIYEFSTRNVYCIELIKNTMFKAFDKTQAHLNKQRNKRNEMKVEWSVWEESLKWFAENQQPAEI